MLCKYLHPKSFPYHSFGEHFSVQLYVCAHSIEREWVSLKRFMLNFKSAFHVNIYIMHKYFLPFSQKSMCTTMEMKRNNIFYHFWVAQQQQVEGERGRNYLTSIYIFTCTWNNDCLSLISKNHRRRQYTK